MDIFNGDTASAQALDSFKLAHGILVKDPAVVLVPAAGEKGEGKGTVTRKSLIKYKKKAHTSL